VGSSCDGRGVSTGGAWLQWPPWYPTLRSINTAHSTATAAIRGHLCSCDGHQSLNQRQANDARCLLSVARGIVAHARQLTVSSPGKGRTCGVVG
jgi:hypothetical protein